MKLSVSKKGLTLILYVTYWFTVIWSYFFQILMKTKITKITNCIYMKKIPTVTDEKNCNKTKWKILFYYFPLYFFISVIFCLKILHNLHNLLKKKKFSSLFAILNLLISFFICNNSLHAFLYTFLHEKVFLIYFYKLFAKL